MTIEQPPDRRTLRVWVRTHRSTLLALCAVGAFAALDLRWLWLYRRGLLLDIDEAGYQTIAVLNYRAWTDGGPSAWLDSVFAPGIQAPLMTAATTPFYGVLGVGRLSGLLVPLLLSCVCLLACFGLGRRVIGVPGAWLCLAAAATPPVIIAFSRSYNFAIAAAAAAALLLWTLARSENWRSIPWSVAVGVAVGLLLLSRTMTVGLVPAVAIAGVIAVLAGPRRARRAVNLGVSGLFAVVVAGPWYYINGAAVYDYLTSFGYGKRLAEYGTDESLLSPTSWRTMLQYASINVGLPLVILWLIACATVLLVLIRRRDILARGRSLAMPSAVFSLWSVLILTSTGNKGSGFLAPVVPAFSLLLAWAVVRAPRAWARGLTAALMLVLALNTVAGWDPSSPLPDRRTVSVGALGPLTVLNGVGTAENYIADGMLHPPADRSWPMTRSRQQAWVAANREAAARVDPTVLTLFTFRHRLLNTNSIQFEELLLGRQPLPITMVSPLETPDADSLTASLTTGQFVGACDLWVATGQSFEIEPRIDVPTVRRAAEAAGFAPTEERWRLPDWRRVTVWHRATCP